jgi:hypothetical protein
MNRIDKLHENITMHQFSVGPGGFKELQKAIINRILFLLAIVVLVLFVLPMIISGTMALPSASTWFTLMFMLPILGFTLYNGLKRQRAMLATYKLIITEDSITREMLNAPTISIPIKEVREIIKAANGAYAILGDSKINAIAVSTEIERKEELEQLLSAIKPLTIKMSTPWHQTFQFPIAFVALALMFASFYIGNRYVSTLCGVAFSSFMIYSFVVLQKSKNIDVRAKRLSYFMLIPLLSVIGSMIMKWME